MYNKNSCLLSATTFCLYFLIIDRKVQLFPVRALLIRRRPLSSCIFAWSGPNDEADVTSIIAAG